MKKNQPAIVPEHGQRAPRGSITGTSLHVRLDAELRADVDRLAARYGYGMAEFVRKTLRDRVRGLRR